MSIALLSVSKYCGNILLSAFHYSYVQVVQVTTLSHGVARVDVHFYIWAASSEFVSSSIPS